MSGKSPKSTDVAHTEPKDSALPAETIDTTEDAPKGPIARVRTLVESGTGAVRKKVKDEITERVEGVRQTVTWASEGVESVKQRVDRTIDAGKSLLQELRHSIDVRRQLISLGPGDRYILQLGASGNAESIKLYGHGEIAVRREGERYLISADGDLGGGVLRELGGYLGRWKTGLSAELLVGGGMGVELSFDSAEDAYRTIDMLLKISALSSVDKFLQDAQWVEKIVPEQVLDVFRLTDDERHFLSRQANAYIYRGRVALELAGDLGMISSISQLGDLCGQSQTQPQISAKIFLDADKQPVFLEIEAQLSQGLSWGIGPKQTLALGNSPLAREAHRTVALILTQRFQIPPSWSQLREEKGLFGALRELAQDILRTREERFALRYERMGDDNEDVSHTVTSLRFVGEWGELLRGEVLKHALQGNLEEMLEALGDHVRLEASSQPFRTTGLDVSPRLGLMGVGVGMHVQAMREVLIPQRSFERKGNARMLAHEVAQQLSHTMRWLSAKHDEPIPEK